MLTADITLTLTVTLSAAELPHCDDPIGVIHVDNAMLEYGRNRVDLVPIPSIKGSALADLEAAILFALGDDVARSELEANR